MLSLKQPLNKDQMNAYLHGNYQIKTTKFSGHHQIKGTAAFLKLCDGMRREFNVQVASFVDIAVQHTPVSFLCPKGHARNAFDQFDPHHVKKSVWCSICTGAHASTTWACPCNRAWHNCPDHFGYPLLAPPKPKAQARGSKRQLVDTAQSSAHKLSHLEPSCASRPILSAGLAKRFPHLVGRAYDTGNSATHNDDDVGDPGQTSSGSGTQWPQSHM